jgi:hypothetical protein
MSGSEPYAPVPTICRRHFHGMRSSRESGVSDLVNQPLMRFPLADVRDRVIGVIRVW